MKEQQVSTSEINTRRHRRELPKAAPRSKDRTFRRSRLIDAARGLFHEKGFAATTIDDIIERIGGSRGTLYIYFGSKLELFETIVREEADRFSKTLDDAFAMGADDMALEEATQKLLDLAQSEDAIGLLRMVIAERQKYPQIGNIYQMVVSRVKEAARRIVRPHLRCVTGEAQDFLAEMFFAIVVADTQMAFLTGTADDQLAQERGRWITRHLATLTNLSGEPNCSRAKTGLFSPSKTAPSV
ncbi:MULTISPECIES: TetR/AcrR family transcriptional regulator [Sphingomonadales]|uniref:TetR/AcrR family transcriptional regulator n=1 Tax=Sphingomonadales TaxID=204457 RepID=UPI000428A26A|nr:MULTISPECIES: TetR/AcrR family transcriptional regulator [Sphingomonadaceae]